MWEGCVFGFGPWLKPSDTRGLGVKSLSFLKSAKASNILEIQRCFIFTQQTINYFSFNILMICSTKPHKENSKLTPFVGINVCFLGLRSLSSRLVGLTRYWGLDYPPLTAYHSWLLGPLGLQEGSTRSGKNSGKTTQFTYG